MSYFVLPRPEGTYATKPSFLDMLMPAVKKFSDSVGQEYIDSTYRKAAKEAGMEPYYQKNADGSWSESYGNRYGSSKAGSDKTNILFALAGLKPMETIMNKEDIIAAAPYTFGEKKLEGGGEVGVPEGSSFDNGVIRNAAGEMIGEYDPDNPPKQTQNYAIAEGNARSKLAEQLTGSPIGRKILGLSEPKEDEMNMTEDFRSALMEAEDAINQGADPEEIKQRLFSLYGDKSMVIDQWFAAKRKTFGR